MIRRILIVVFILGICLNFNVSALSGISIEAEKDFLSFAESPEKVSSILKIDVNELADICESNKVEYLSVNKDNTKQIRITVSQNDFTNSIINISGLSNDEITSLMPEILSDSNLKGEIIDKNGQKFIKTDIRLTDSGGEYILTEYITVANKESIVLSFYTAASQSTDYVEPCFESFNAKEFNNNQKENKLTLWQYILPAAIVVFAIVFIIVGITVIMDLKKKNAFSEEPDEAAVQ